MSDLPGATRLDWIRDNPKLAGSSARKRFDEYRGSATVDKFFSNGGYKDDLKNDMNHGYVWVKKRPAAGPKIAMKVVTARKSRASLSLKRTPVIKTSKSRKKKPATKSVASNPRSSSSNAEKTERAALDSTASNPGSSSSNAEKTQRAEPGIEEQTSKRIACIGDSNTTSYGTASYPQLLQSALDTRNGCGSYRVRSFGVSGASAAATHGRKHYGSLVKFIEAKAFKADTYVIMLGTNDAWHAWGEPLRAAPGISELIQSLAADALSAGSREPSILIVLPPGAKPGRLVENLKNIIHPAIIRLASAEANVKAVDPKMFGKEWYKQDMVHLNAQGAKRIADKLAAAIP